jgi:dipeptidyl aminopeptidase/acylaminoacyl peptidase
MSDQGVTGGDVWQVPSTGGEPVDLTPNRAASAAWIEWAGNQELFVSELAGGNSQLVLLRLHASRSCTFGAGVHGPVFSIPATVTDGRAEMSLSAGAGHNLFVFKASSFDRPEEIYAARADSVISACAGSEEGNLTQLTHWNDGVKPGWGKVESITWTNAAFHIQGWLLLPLHYDPAKKYPLLVEVHGGPAAAARASWRGSFGDTFSALDYFVFMPNPRGSFGQGEAFTQANRKDFGYGDLQDILLGVDTVLNRYPVDPNRVGIFGWSYGGFLSMFAVTQTHRFQAAVAGAGISDWQSYYGENRIDQWMIPYFGASVYDDPSVYAKSSAITFIKQASTPTLVVVGDRDGECPAPQSFEFWHALRDRHVPTQLVVYPNEGHGFTDPGHRRDVLRRAVDWFARYLPPGP